MGKRNKATASGLGKTIIKDRFGKRRTPGKEGNFLHTSELQDGYDWGRLNLQSVTEQSNLEDFLSTAELAGTEFTAEKLNIKFVDPNKHSGLLSKEEQEQLDSLQDKHRSLLRIPRRPPWDESTTPEELDRKERDSFLEWRRTLASLQEVEGLVLTPYEKNLDFWRQLWRVIERSDVIVQVVDARNPLLFRCGDLENYIREIDPNKVSMILVNKADFLSQQQREMWYDYFTKQSINVAFWSALEETERQTESNKDTNEDELIGDNSDIEEEEEDESDSDNNMDEKLCDTEGQLSGGEQNDCDTDTSVTHNAPDERLDKLHIDNNSKDSSTCEKCKDESLEADAQVQSYSCHSNNNTEGKMEEKSGIDGDKDIDTEGKMEDKSGIDLNKDIDTEGKMEDKSGIDGDKDSCDINNVCEDCGGSAVNDNTETTSGAQAKHPADILQGQELLDMIRALHEGKKFQEGQTTVGMVGYPNVGKSSTINAIIKMKKVPVSATPGRTKHFQTLYVEKDLMLCDCPGLVFPSFVSTKAELIINGILPIDQMRDHVPPVSLVCRHIPRVILEEMYSVNIPPPQEGEDPLRPPTATELLNVYGYIRGFMTASGLPDCPRASRYVLKDYVNGRLLYCHPPPGADTDVFQPTRMQPVHKLVKASTTESKPVAPSKLDREFFSKDISKIHSLGSKKVTGFTRVEGLKQVSRSGTPSSGMDSPYSSQQSLTEKSWKKHKNRNKKEKLRRVFNYHDKTERY